MPITGFPDLLYAFKMTLEATWNLLLDFSEFKMIAISADFFLFTVKEPLPFK